VPRTEKPEEDDKEADISSVPKTWEDVYSVSTLRPTRKQFYRVLCVVFDFRG
jgi:hypothetical protein